MHLITRRRGLTLIELLVVLVVLAALSGIAVAVVPRFLKKTHGSTSASSIQSAESAITAQLITGGILGDGFDQLNDNTAGAGVVPDYVGDPATFATVTADAAMVSALSELGITQTYPTAFADRAAVVTADANATFNGHDYTAPIAITAATTPLTTVTLALTDIQNTYNLSPTDYADTGDEVFAFGLGQECTLVGLDRAFKEAPVHTPGEGSATTTYSRYAILIGYDASEGEARYLGCTCIDDGAELKAIQGNLAEFYEN